ncbi:AAA family ATPase [Acidovorax sp. BL-A-41-H1]|uniref:AAA family ATPase n=1 Tax=Acidovorax sp. BL-A-41-H1 TaxID=3421102 RepID=UPI003F7AD98C
MLNQHIIPSDNSETDPLKSAAIMFTARRREQEAAELSAENQPTSRRSNPFAAAMVAEILGSKTEAIPEEAKDAGASRDTPSLEAEKLLAPSTEAQPPGTVQDDAPHADHERPEPSLPESELKIDEDSDPVRLPKQAREFGLLTRADVQAEPSAIPLIHGLISKGQLVMIAGPSGSGKSVFQLHLGAALLNGPVVFGHAIPKRARMLYVNLEGDLKPRLEAIEQHHPGWSFPAPDAMFLTRPWRLNDRDSVEDLANHVNQAGGVDVIFIDTLNRATPGSDENLSTDMGMVIAHANLLINLTGAAVVLTHHTGKAKERGPRGHSSLYAALDTCLMVDETESGMRMVELVKTRQGPGGKKYYFTIENIALGEDDYGLPIVGPALMEVEGSPEVEKAATAPALTPQQKEALLALTLHMQNGLNGEPLEGVSRDEALEVVKAAFSAVSSKHRSTRAREAIDALIEAGRLLQNDSGMLTIGS